MIVGVIEIDKMVSLICYNLKVKIIYIYTFNQN